MYQFKNQYLKRSQKDCSLSFKLAVVQEVESGSIGNLQRCVSIASRGMVLLPNGAENMIPLI